MTHNQRELLRNILYEKRNFMKYESDRLFLHLRPDIYEYMKDQMTNEYLLEYEHYAGKKFKMFRDEPIKRKRREHIIEGQEALF